MKAKMNDIKLGTWVCDFNGIYEVTEIKERTNKYNRYIGLNEIQFNNDGYELDNYTIWINECEFLRKELN